MMGGDYKQTRCTHGWVDQTQCEVCKLQSQLSAAQAEVAKIPSIRDAWRQAEQDLQTSMIDAKNLREEIAAEKLKSENIIQMVSDRISQIKHDDEGLSPDDVHKEISIVAAATGNKCGDDSLWFAGKEWQKLKKFDDDCTAALADLLAAIDDHDRYRSVNSWLIVKQAAARCREFIPQNRELGGGR